MQLHHNYIVSWLPPMLILSQNCMWMQLLTTSLSPALHSWSFQKCTSICLTWSWALHCHPVNGSRVPSQKSQRFASILPTAQDCTIADYYTMSLWSHLTACHAQVQEPSAYWSLHFNVKKKRRTYIIPAINYSLRKFLLSYQICPWIVSLHADA